MGKKYRKLYMPMLLASTIDSTYMTRLHLSVAAFAEGMATENDLSVLHDCTDLLIIGTSNRNEKDLCSGVKCLRIAIENIYKLYMEERKLLAKEEEVEALKAIVKIHEDFWKRQSGNFYELCVNGLRDFRNRKKETKKEN